MLNMYVRRWSSSQAGWVCCTGQVDIDNCIPDFSCVTKRQQLGGNITYSALTQQMADVATTHITRTKATADGGSVFEEVAVPLDNKNWIGSLSKGTEVHEIVFRETDGAYDLDWHTAPCRQFIIMTNEQVVAGGVDVTTTDGVTKRFKDGDVLLVEDITGKGHRSKAVDNKPRKSILVKLRDDAPAFMPQQTSTKQ